MKNKNIIIITLCTFIVLSFTAGIIGLLERNSKKEKPPVTKYKATYVYLLDDKEVTAIPKNEKDKNSVSYSRYSCTNRVEGSWDNEKWSFTPVLTANTTCKIYFVSTEFEMSFKIENGSIANITPDQTGIYKANKKGATTADFIQEILPKEGYSYKDASCNSNNEISWDKENKELTIKNIKENTLCTVNFEISNYEVKTLVENGSGASSLTIKHGENANATVTPSIGYGTPVITCTNKQNGTWINDKFTVTKVTDNTSCTVTFKPLTFDINLSVTNGTSDVKSPIKLEYNKTKTFTLTPSDGYLTDDYVANGCDNFTKTIANNKLVLEIKTVKTNETCNITFNKATPKP
ncbi:MAG: hypothetical protein RR228_02230 [Bacilli bacterium]